MLHENRLPADDSHEILCLICYFWKSGKLFNCRLLQIIGGAFRVKRELNAPLSLSLPAATFVCSLYFDMQHDHIPRKLNTWACDPNPWVEGVCKDRIFAFMVLYSLLPLIWYATWLLSEKKKMFWPFNPPPGSPVLKGPWFFWKAPSKKHWPFYNVVLLFEYFSMKFPQRPIVSVSQNTYFPLINSFPMARQNA